MQKIKAHPLITGTLILTFAGMLTRLIGFFYKIYLADLMGTTELGLYQLIFPVYSLCYTVYAAGIQTALSQCIAGEKDNPEKIRKYLQGALFISVGLSLILMAALCLFARPVAKHFLLEEICTNRLRIMSILFPFCAVSSCLNGYYYGIKKTGVPALTQLTEQVSRIIFVYGIAMIFLHGQKEVSCELAVAGLVAGEVIACFFMIVCFSVTEKKHLKKRKKSSFSIPDNQVRPAREIKPPYELKQALSHLCFIAVPLTGTKLITSILHSAETILIPGMLKKFGMTAAEALSMYGVLTGMAMTFLLFPSTITAAFSILLLPSISEEEALGNHKKISCLISLSIKYSLLIGFLFTTLFLLYGPLLGQVFFQNELCGRFLVILSFLCPLLYLSTTLGSILNGLGRTDYTFISTIISLGIRIAFVIFAIPKFGIYGYLIGMLISQLIFTFIQLHLLNKLATFTFDGLSSLIIPMILCVISGFAGKLFVGNMLSASSGFMRLILEGGTTCVVFLFLCIITKIISLPGKNAQIQNEKEQIPNRKKQK